MKIIELFNTLKSKVEKIDKKAKNPFLDCDYAHNPFKGSFKSTYVWIEKDK